MKKAIQQKSQNLNNKVGSKNSNSNFYLQDNRITTQTNSTKTLQAKVNTNSVIQFSRETAQRNWRVVVQYASDQANNVDRAFLRAGYAPVEAGRLIVRLTDELGYGDQLFAHGSGSSGSGMQGDTMPRIRALVQALIDWAQNNPKPESSSKKGDGSKRGDGDGDKKDKKPKKDDDKGGGGSGGSVLGTGHLASWVTGVPAWISQKTN